MNPSEPDSRPAAPLSWGAKKLESRAPAVVRRLRRARDQSLIWRDSFEYRHYPDPGKPFGARYLRQHWRFIAAALGDGALLDRFRTGAQLPDRYGVGHDERAVELPWLVSRGPAGRVLDAGSALNHAVVLDRLLPSVDALCAFTLAAEARSFNERGVSYVYGDLRELPFRDGWFDAVASVSTLEHVGMDVTRWGAHTAAAPDPDEALAAALAELSRVTRAGGRLLVTVPYGQRDDLGWLRQFDREGIERLVSWAAPTRSEVTVYAYGHSGWRLSSLEEAAGARYQRGNRPASDPAREDRAAAARAVACIEATV
jgi:SAM-dependent methyltransferase